MPSTPVYDSHNIFARILRGEIPCDLVYEDERVLAFRDIQPAAPVHVLVIPRGEYVSFVDFAEKAGSEAVAEFFHSVHHVILELGLEASGCRIITNHGAHASQTVPHFHVHILGGRPLGALLADDAQVR